MEETEIFEKLQSEFGRDIVLRHVTPVQDQEEEIADLENQLEQAESEEEREDIQGELDEKKDSLSYSDSWIEIQPDHIDRVCSFLKEEDDLAFDYLRCLSGMDWSELDHVEAEDLGVTYHLFSMRHSHKVTLKVHVSREDPVVPTVSGIWGGANWHEREAYDMVGIKFSDHPYMRRMLCPEDWEGHPLRKDYEVQEYYRNVRVPY